MKIQNNEDHISNVQPRLLELEKVVIPKQELQYLYSKIREYEVLVKNYEDQLKIFMEGKIHQSSL